MRKTALVILIVALLCISSAIALADESCGAALTWELSSSGTLTIRGTGDMMDCSYGKAPWYDMSDEIKSVVIEEGVTSIGEYAFYRCQELTKIQLPASLTTIGEDAFYSCSKLPSITIPTGVTSIGCWAFFDCNNLKSVMLPEGLISIDALAFWNCTSLRELTIPSSVESISDDRVFIGCKELEKILVAEGNSSYVSIDGIIYSRNQSALLCYPAGKVDSSYTIPDSVKDIGDYAFHGNEYIQSITIPGNVKSIGSSAFDGCSKLSNLTLSEGIETIGTSAFANAKSLTTADLPASLVSLGANAFVSCRRLTSINVSDGSSSYVSVDGVLFSSDMATLVAYPAGNRQTAYVIPNGVTTIGEYSFSYNDYIVDITFPESLMVIDNDAFNSCNQISNLQLPPKLAIIDDRAFSSCNGLTSVVLPQSVYVLGSSAFSGCERLDSVTVMNPVTDFDEWNVFSSWNDRLTITGMAGSTAEAFAKEKDIFFIAATFDEAGYTSGTKVSWACANCGKSLKGGKFCSECGTPKPEKQICSDCGFIAPEGEIMKYCPECGTKFK